MKKLSEKEKKIQEVQDALDRGNLSPESVDRVIGEMTDSIHHGWLEEDMPIIRKIHKTDATTIVSLYRSAMVVLKKTPEQIENGAVTIIFYHDPAWIGNDTNEETMKQHRQFFEIQGQRSGPDILKQKPECGCFCD